MSKSRFINKYRYLDCVNTRPLHPIYWYQCIRLIAQYSSRYSTNTSRKFAVQKQLFMPNVSVTANLRLVFVEYLEL